MCRTPLQRNDHVAFLATRQQKGADCRPRADDGKDHFAENDARSLRALRQQDSAGATAAGSDASSEMNGRPHEMCKTENARGGRCAAAGVTLLTQQDSLIG
jgi:hypothetical protein